ncbi:unnamed protein product [Caenorhabditis angaria]|uniref:Uncharacterized protein n=1 Tax=Caenorhabditis angaria TaxID=860376 RepID=A0A9P1IF46_9PELO|nr:unnamed protein product [Caenorhabditis angaria]
MRFFLAILAILPLLIESTCNSDPYVMELARDFQKLFLDTEKLGDREALSNLVSDKLVFMKYGDPIPFFYDKETFLGSSIFSINPIKSAELKGLEVTYKSGTNTEVTFRRATEYSGPKLLSYVLTSPYVYPNNDC